MRSYRLICRLVVLVMVGMAFGCGGAEKDSENRAAKGPVYTATGDEGNIYGVISYTGTAPAPKMISMASDPVCASGGEARSEELIVTDGKLQNVFVYVKSGLPNNSFPATAPEVTLDQKGCRFEPHIVGLHTDQSIRVVNSDATSHSIHPTPKVNREWNETQYQSASPIVKKFNLEEVLIPVKCNLHSWMRAYIGVLPHPFFSVSAADGKFAIKGLPPGDYEIEAWHEKLGAKTMRVSVKARADIPALFSFGEATASAPGSLQVQPALVIGAQ